MCYGHWVGLAVVWIGLAGSATDAWAETPPAGGGTGRNASLMPPEAGPRKWALLVGANHYADVRFPNLACCAADVAALKTLLVQHAGFPENQVFVLSDEQEAMSLRPMKASIERMLEAFVALPGPDDQVIVAFSVHGAELSGKGFLCPADADLDNPSTTLLPVSWLYDQLDLNCQAKHKVVIIDACRNEPPGQTRGAAGPTMPEGLVRSLRSAPEGFLVLSSCAAGQVSYEDNGLGHGVFFNSILRGLAGAADRPADGLPGNADGRVEAQELFQFAAASTRQHVQETFHGSQTPEITSRYSEPVYLTIVGKRSERVEVPVPESIEEVRQRVLPERERMQQIFALTKIAERQAEDDMPSALTLIDEALRLAGEFPIEKRTGGPFTIDAADSLRDQALETIANAQARMKDSAGCVNTAAMIDNRVRRKDCFLEVAMILLEAQDFRGAFAAAGLAHDISAEYHLIANVAVAAARAGDFRVAREGLEIIGQYPGVENARLMYEPTKKLIDAEEQKAAR